MRWLYGWIVVFGSMSAAAAAPDDSLFGITARTNAYTLPYCKPAKQEFYYDCEIPAAASLFTHAKINFDSDEGVCGISLSVDLEEKDSTKERVEAIVRLLDDIFGHDKAVRTSLSRLISNNPRDWWTKVGFGVSIDTVDNAWRIEENAKLRKLWEANLLVTRRSGDRFHVQLDAYFHPHRYCYKPPLPTKYTIRELPAGALK
ncbi:MAG: hypothetical protein AB7E79_07975 [Rhodospirillaceae bacterium]